MTRPEEMLEGSPSYGEIPKDGAGIYSIGSDTWPGISKLTEEAGEVMQVVGKLMGTGGSIHHWDRNQTLAERLVEELGDLTAAIEYVIDHNDQIDRLAVAERFAYKRDLFASWHDEAQS